MTPEQLETAARKLIKIKGPDFADAFGDRVSRMMYCAGEISKHLAIQEAIDFAMSKPVIDDITGLPKLSDYDEFYRVVLHEIHRLLESCDQTRVIVGRELINSLKDLK